jgi:prepilin-type N-terminal cleavage/methylation domain-containing protein
MRLTTGDDRGLTLTEILITVVIMGIIIVPLGNAIIGFIRLTDQTTARLSESHDAQIAAAYFAQDVQSLGTRDWSAFPYPLRPSVELNVAATAGAFPCGTASTPVAVLRLAWDDPDTATGVPPVVRAAYTVVMLGPERQLHRILCRGSATPVSDIVVAHDLDTVAPVVTCPTPCTAPNVPAAVTLTLTVRAPKNTGTGLVFVLSGQRRQT